MPSTKILQSYAKLAIQSGVNVQKGQTLVISVPVDAKDFARLCVREAYQAGAGEVLVRWEDEPVTLMRYEKETTETLTAVPGWQVEYERYWTGKKGAILRIVGDTPGALAGIGAQKLVAVQRARSVALKEFQSYTRDNHGQWCILAHPTIEWAAKVFPELPPEKALDKLWDAVLQTVRVTEDNDPVGEWKKHNERLRRNCEILTKFQFRAFRLRNSLGTDLTVGVVKNHIWTGGGAEAESGVYFNPNMPTEEIFTMPDKRSADGKVVASRPLFFQGKEIRNFWFRFQDGAVVDYGAETGGDALRNVVEFDEGSRRLGELSLVPFHSPISQQNMLYQNTLFDENAACHLALGATFASCVQNGTALSREELDALGANDSLMHCDFMFGTEDLQVAGIAEDGSETPVFINGDFNPSAGFEV